MRKLGLALFLVSVLALSACGKGDAKDDSTIKIGASSTPHAEILEEAKPLLEEEGIELEIEEYEDYVLPNDDLASGEIDGNYFQHIPFLEQTIEDTGYELTDIGGVHIEPMGVYSKSIDSVDAIPDGTEVVLSNSVAEHGRILKLFEDEGLITLNEDVDVDAATIDDIEDNPKDLKFTPDYEPALLPEIYESDEDTLVVINTNYAIDAGLTPLEDSLFIENDESPYVNVIAVKEEDKDNEALNTLVEVLHSDDIQDFINEKYEGAVVPVTK